MPVDPSVLKEIFLSAAELSGPARVAYLDTACGHDTELRLRIEGLLQAHDAPGDFPAAYLPARDREERRDGAEALGTCIGPYALSEQIGEGGMGTVFLAEQMHPVQRQVALKLIKAGMDSRQVIARFETERQSLALMDHANIARVLDAGTTGQGRPYFVMELVHGVPITEYCDDHRMTVRQRLELFLPVCRAIQHAHQKGIIHRDIKPSNVMISHHDGLPVPKVIDFGVAKAIESPISEVTRFTQFGAMIGTLEYMSPEQAEMDPSAADTRSDVYSLGVLLYELLTGSTPISRQRMRESNPVEILRIIKEEEPDRPSARLSNSGAALAEISARRHVSPNQLTKLVHGELDWIALKALEKDRNRRYATANDLAADVQRFLRDEPIEAGPPGAGYRVRKFIRRHRGGAIAAGLVSMSLIAGVVGTALGLVHAKQAQAEAIEERNERQVALDKLVSEQEKTKTALAAQTRARSQAYLALRTMTDDLVVGLLARQPHLGASERAYLHKVVSFFDQLAHEHGDSSEGWKVRGDGYWLAGRIRDILGDTKEAEAAYRAALAARQHLVTESPDDPDFRYAVADCHVELGKQVAKAGRWREAESSFVEAITILTGLMPEGQGDAKVSDLLAHSHDRRGLLLVNTGRMQEAEAAYREAVAIISRGPKSGSNEPSADPHHFTILADSHDHLAILLARTGRHQDGEVAHQIGLEVRKKLAAEFPLESGFQANLAISHMNLGVEFADTGRVPQAEASFRECVAIMRKLVADFPLAPLYREKLAGGLANLGTLLNQTGRGPEAEEIHSETLTLLRKLTTDFPGNPNYGRDLATAHFNLGGVFKDTGRLQEAEAAYREAIGLQTKLAAPPTGMPALRRDLSGSQSNLGLVLVDLQRNEEAETAYRAALTLDEQLAAEFPTVSEFAVNVGRTCCNLGSLFQSTDREADAIDWYDRAVAALNPVVTKQPRLMKARMFLRNSHAGRAETLGKLNRHADAVKDWDRAVELSPVAHRTMVQMHRALCLAHAGESAKATAAADEALTAPRPSALVLYDAACVFAVSAAAVQDDKVLREKYGARAVELLARARAAGHFRDPATVDHMKNDTDLKALRSRDDYRAWLGALEQGTPSPESQIEER